MKSRAVQVVHVGRAGFKSAAWRSLHRTADPSFAADFFNLDNLDNLDRDWNHSAFSVHVVHVVRVGHGTPRARPPTVENRICAVNIKRSGRSEIRQLSRLTVGLRRRARPGVVALALVGFMPPARWSGADLGDPASELSVCEHGQHGAGPLEHAARARWALEHGRSSTPLARAPPARRARPPSCTSSSWSSSSTVGACRARQPPSASVGVSARPCT
jgi:hypothetical protein